MLFEVNEIIVYDIPDVKAAAESVEPVAAKKIVFGEEEQEEPKPVVRGSAPSWEAVAAANMLQYLVTPIYLRKQLFGDLKMYKKAKKLPRVPGQEALLNGKLVQGVAIKKSTPKKKGKKSKKEKQDARLTPFVNIGFDHVFELEDQVPVHSQVTIDMSTKKPVTSANKSYTVRAVRQFSKIFTESSVPGGYTHAIYAASQQFTGKPVSPPIHEVTPAQVQEYERPLLVFGKWTEVEAAAKGDHEMPAAPHELFDAKLPGSETARLEDSVMICLARISK